MGASLLALAKSIYYGFPLTKGLAFEKSGFDFFYNEN